VDHVALKKGGTFMLELGKIKGRRISNDSRILVV